MSANYYNFLMHGVKILLKSSVLFQNLYGMFIIFPNIFALTPV